MINVEWPEHILDKARRALVLYGYVEHSIAKDFIMSGAGDHWHAMQCACIAAATEEEIKKYMPNNVEFPQKKKVMYEEIHEEIIKKSRTIISRYEK